jgi:hypothetical protein
VPETLSLDSIHPADQLQAKADRKLVQEIERAAVLLRKAMNIHEIAVTLGTLDEQSRDQLRKLRQKARHVAANALQQDELC